MPKPRVRHVIIAIVDQYAMARGNYDVEFTVARMSSKRMKTFEDGDKELEAYFDGEEAYWESHGWKLIRLGKKKVLKWVGKTLTRASA